ncbi:LINE-1 retrotransposable element ORF2 protein [Acropora cervicornis]|uniref:LINE-1 retrotransposable element ORF2 protein n=1 Tax=Acropora cervicornis TaxID=6130 RepID=A0AAD9UTS9_ACRCE|nr:LINE-1 retrotransposable element ORF2 protein [Acropora cervicornis]
MKSIVLKAIILHLSTNQVPSHANKVKLEERGLIIHEFPFDRRRTPLDLKRSIDYLKACCGTLVIPKLAKGSPISAVFGARHCKPSSQQIAEDHAARLKDPENPAINKSLRTATLLTCIGSDALDVYEGLEFDSEDDKQDIDIVLQKLQRYCFGETNEIYERYRFNKRDQEPNESLDAYVTALRTLAKTCNFGVLENSLIRDRIAIGVRDDQTHKKLLQVSKLTLKECIDICRSYETSNHQLKEINQEEVSAITQSNEEKSREIRCKHVRKPVHAVEDSDFDEYVACVDVKEHVCAVENPNRKDTLLAVMLLNGYRVPFQLDTGATVNILPEVSFKEVYGEGSLSLLDNADMHVVMYNRTEEKPIGKKRVQSEEPSESKPPLTTETILKEHADVFRGEGKLEDAIKQNGQINGITVNNEEFLLGQYADDTFFLLDGTQTSLSQRLDTLELLGECSGLKVNVEKAKAIWLGSKRFSKEILLPEKNLAWVFNETFDILGIAFFVETQQIVEYNYRMKLDEVRKLVDSWSRRLLSIIGKIQVIKSLAISKLVHLFTTLATPNDSSFKELETLFFSFIWGGKGDKIARKIIINDIENGGLKMTDIRSFAKALKISWIKKVWDVNYQADWKRLLISDRLYWNDVWLLNNRSLSLLACSFMENTFWRNVVESWAEYVQETVEANDILSQPLWNNAFIEIENKYVFYKLWYIKNLCYDNDLVDESGVFMSPTELINKFNLKCTFLQAYGIICVIPSSWKSKIRVFGERLLMVKFENIERLFKTKKVEISVKNCNANIDHAQPLDKKAALRVKFPKVFEGLSKLKGHQLKGHQLKLHQDDGIPPVAQPLRRIPFSRSKK